jgi:hypothetical protein
VSLLDLLKLRARAHSEIRNCALGYQVIFLLESFKPEGVSDLDVFKDIDVYGMWEAL